MRDQISRRRLLAGLLASVPCVALADAQADGPPFFAPTSTPLPRRRGDGGKTRAEPGDAERLIAEAKLGGVVSMALIDVDSGALIETRSGQEPLPPASTAKAITAAFAAQRLGLDHRFATTILATGPVQGGVVQGDLILAGGGDPTLDTDRLDGMAQRLAAQGVTGATGGLRVWGGALPELERIDEAQPDHVGYNPAISGLNLNFNRVHFEWRRAGKAWALGFDARGERLVPPVHLASMALVTRDLPLFTYARDGAAERWTVAEPALGKGGSRWLPTRLPALYAGEVFRTLAKAHGIRLPAPTRIETLPEGEPLVADQSAGFDTVLRDMLEFSTNITAEVVGLSATGAGGLRASAQAMNAWAAEQFGPGLGFVDHSGLGEGARITAEAMARAMAVLAQGPLPALLHDHGMRDAQNKRIEGHPVRVLAKTGTLNFASGLAGLIVLPSGRRLAFAIYAADLPRRAALTEAEREEPQGGAAWVKRARLLQARLIERWALLQA